MPIFWPKKSRVFLVPLSAYGFSGLPRSEKNKEKNYEKKIRKSKIVFFPDIVISGIPLSRVRRPGSHVVTDFPFYGFLNRAS